MSLEIDHKDIITEGLNEQEVDLVALSHCKA